MRTSFSDAERFLGRTDRTGSCWLWKGAVDPTGYGRFSLGGAMLYAHRYAYETFVEPIPASLEIDHLCRKRACVNPAHLQAVSRSENIARKAEGPSSGAVPDHMHGTLTGYTSYRCRCASCREANRLYMRSYRAKEPAA